MTTRKFTIGLIAAAAMLFAATSHAGDISLEISGLSSDSGSDSYASTTDQDCDNPRPVVADTSITRSTASSTRTGAGGPTQAEGVTAPAASATASSGGGTTAESIGAPLKARSSRWQSLVPGAIK